MGGEPLTNEWVRDGLAAAEQTFVPPLVPVDLPPVDTGTPPRAMKRLLYPSFAMAVRQTVREAPPSGFWSSFRRALRQAMQARLGHRPIVGLSQGLGFAEWLADECHCRIVCLASHPLAMAAHHKRASDGPADRWLERACREWVVARQWVAGFHERRPDFAFVWDHDIIGEPFVGFHRLYRQLELTWSPKSQRTISSMMEDRPVVQRCRPVRIRPDAWRAELTVDEVARVRAETETGEWPGPPLLQWPEASPARPEAS